MLIKKLLEMSDKLQFVAGLSAHRLDKLKFVGHQKQSQPQSHSEFAAG